MNPIDEIILGRRKMLKNTAAAGTGLATATSLIGSQAGIAAAYSEIDNNGTYADTQEVINDSCGTSSRAYPGQRILQNSGVSLVYVGSFENLSNEVLHQFETSSHASVRSKSNDWQIEDEYEPINAVSNMQLTLWNLRDQDTSLLTPEPSDNRMVGATPNPSGDSYNYGDAAYTAIKTLFGMLHPAVAAFIGAADTVDALKNNDEDEDGQRVTYDWSYGGLFGGQVSDATGFVESYIESDASDPGFDFQVEADQSLYPEPTCPPETVGDDDTWAALRLKIDDPNVEQTSTAGRREIGTLKNEDITNDKLKEFANGEDLTVTEYPVTLAEPVRK